MADVNERDALHRASKAQALLNDPELNQAFDAVRAAIIEKIEACPIRDDDGLRILRLQLKLLKDVRMNLESVVNTGKVVQDRISFMERIKRKTLNVY